MHRIFVNTLAGLLWVLFIAVNILLWGGLVRVVRWLIGNA
jgi:hypothetical protein